MGNLNSKVLNKGAAKAAPAKKKASAKKKAATKKGA
jgi:hypothetical protein